MYKHLLVPLDGSPLSNTTVDQAVAYARATGARLTFFHARPDLGATGEGALLHAMTPESFVRAAAGNAQLVVAKAEIAARAASVECASIIGTSDRLPEAILEAARVAACDLVFIASHGRSGLKGALLGSVTTRLLQRATLPVLVAAVERNLAAHSDEQRALETIRDEHRSLAAVLQALLESLDDPNVDPDLLRAMLYFVEQFPERLHHPKEDVYLFNRLRERTSECDALLTELQQQHIAGAQRFLELRRAFDAGDRAAFAQGVRDFAQLQWQHMSTEERLVMPAAGRHLQPADWREITEAFSANGDPRFGTGESFEALASRLLALARADR
jgi:nucleotide-binding universal stress UspA family protein/hemerythrin-like domain-containing protein